ncbi:MAG TPA: VanZ family protein [Telluria sp.]
MPAFLSLLILDPKLRKLRCLCAVALYLAIVIMGSIPGARSQIGVYAPGVVLHSLAYATLAFLWFTGSSGSPAARAAKAMLAVAGMGALDELVQSFFPYRGADVGDWMVDCGAAAVTCALLWAFLPRAGAAR